MLKDWDYINAPNSTGCTVFVNVWDEFEKGVFSDEFDASGVKLPWPHESTLIDIIKRKDSSFKFFDDITTPETETLEDIVLRSFKKTVPALVDLEKNHKLEWAKFKDTKVLHLARLDALSSLHLDNGGGEHVINATKAQHG
ncbi:MAG TPA: penicillin acylase family protein, partial [Ginsengibacter sp.]|nr:penicillin acylase family protein [Ginsengibacter sp.]